MDEPRWLTDEEQFAWRSFLFTNTVLMASLDRQLQQDVGMPHAYYVTLAMLSEHPDRSMTMSELAEATRSSPSKLSHAVSKLEANGWMTRHRDPRSGRQIIATLTDAGLDIVRSTAPIHVDHVRKVMFDALTPEQVAQMVEIFRAVLDNLDELGDKPAGAAPCPDPR